MAGKVKRVVDLVFLIDITGSMTPCIEGLKASVDHFFKHLTEENNQGCSNIRDWRAKVVGFRDVDYDGSDWLEDNPFVTTVEEIEAQLSALQARGGGDEPESLLDALAMLADMGETPADAEPDPMKWRNAHQAARAVVAMTDATYQPTMMLEGYEGGTVEDVCRKIADERIILALVTPSAPADSTVSQEDFEACHEALAQADRAEYIPLYVDDRPLTFSDIPANPQLFEDFIAQLAKTLSASVPAQKVEGAELTENDPAPADDTIPGGPDGDTLS